MTNANSPSFLHKLFSLLSVVRGYNIVVLIAAQYLAAIFIFSPKKTVKSVVLNEQLLFIVLACICVVAAGYIINNFYDAKADKINRPIKSGLENYVSQQTKLKIYFSLNFLGFVFGLLVSWRSGMFFALYIFGIWFYSHKLKRYPFIGLISVAVLTILPFFAVFVYFKNFSKVIFVHALFLFLIILIREMVKDLENLKGAIASNYNTFPVAYGEERTKALAILCILFALVPVTILLNYKGIGYMRYYFYFSFIVLTVSGFYLWFSKRKSHYVLLHNILKLLLLAGVFSLLFIDPSVLLEKVINKLN
ncbi:MAG: geranylgeranylglycerol-phosphate geranylgeranyltransferase [Flavobacteriaceae bacterium]